MRMSNGVASIRYRRSPPRWLFVRGRSKINSAPKATRERNPENAVLETMSISPKEQQRRLRSLLDELGIASLARSRASVLSGGERRKLEITRALLLEPRFLCLDEPFAGIDPITVVEIQRIISYLRHRSIGVLISDHNVRETLSIIDRAYIIHAGKILFEGRPQKIVRSARVRQVFLGEHFELN
jgi:lipopolysaccharide export system ATP-binding protein